MPPPNRNDSAPADVSGPTGSFPPAGEAGFAPESRAADAHRYTREGLLGKGGMGTVYLARDHRLDRAVALKEAASGGDTAARLGREARITAGLEHPGIVTVHDSGVTEDGRPFYTMRLLRGRALSQVLAERRALADRLGLVRHYLDACNAVAFAHAQGVIHRDLKPANIMVGGFGETQVVDWGLATRAGGAVATEGASGRADAEVDADRTRTGAVLGTPAYMSPEQARGEAALPQADVWSLGAVLAELLSGEAPWGEGTSDELLARARTGGPPPLRPLPGAPAELVAIAMRATAADPAFRYPDAGALAVDVEAWLDGRPVHAHRYTPWELLQRLYRAWRAPILVGSVAIVAVVGLVVVGTLRVSRERDRVVAAEREVRTALVSSDAHLSQALVSEARAAMDQGATAVAAVLASHAVAIADAPEAWGVLAGVGMEARAERMGEVPIRECPGPLLLGPEDWVCVDTHAVWRVTGGDRRWTWSGAPISALLDGERLHVAEESRVQALDLTSGRARPAGLRFGSTGKRFWPIEPAAWGEPESPSSLSHLAARFCPGSALASATPALAQNRYVVTCTDGRVGAGAIGMLPDRYLATPVTRDSLSGIVGAELTPDGGTLVLAGTKGGLAVVELATGATHTGTTAARDGGWRLAVSADGGRVAIVGDRGDLEVRVLPDLSPLVRLPTSARDARFLPDGSLLVAEAEVVSRWRLPTTRASSVLRGRDGLTGVSFSPDGTRLATSHGRFEGLIWDPAAAERLAALPLGEGTAKAAAFTPDGAVAWFAMTGAGGPWRPEPLRADGAPVERLADALLLPDAEGKGSFPSRRVVILQSGVLLAPGYDASRWLLALDTRTRQPVVAEGCPGVEWFDAAQSPGGEHAVLVGEAGLVVLVDPGPPLRCMPGFVMDGAVAADVAADGTLAVATESEVRITDSAGTLLRRLPYSGRGILDVAISADGKWVAAGGTDHLARVWDATGRLRAVLAAHHERVATLDFRPDGRVLATGSWDGTARLWSLDVLDVPAATLDGTAATTWGLTLPEALAVYDQPVHSTPTP